MNKIEMLTKAADMVTASAFPDPEFESAHLYEPDGDYTQNLQNVGWTCVYRVQLKNVSQTIPIQIENINIPEQVREYFVAKGGKQEWMMGSINANYTPPAFPITLQPDAELEIEIPLERVMAIPVSEITRALGVLPYISVDFTLAGTLNYADFSGMAS